MQTYGLNRLSVAWRCVAAFLGPFLLAFHFIVGDVITSSVAAIWVATVAVHVAVDVRIHSDVKTLDSLKAQYSLEEAAYLDQFRKHEDEPQKETDCPREGR